MKAIYHKWRLKYDTLGGGTGLLVTAYNVPADHLGNINSSPYFIGVWTVGLLFNHDGTHFFAPIPDDGDYHIYKIDVHGFYYYYYLDGVLHETARGSKPSDQANSIFIGSPDANLRTAWSNISIDYIKISVPSSIFKLP